MLKVDLLDFQTALSRVSGAHLKVLLGNGFSRALFDDIFSYKALLDQADFTDLSPYARDAFTRLNTNSFEEVIRVLLNSATMGSLYEIGDKGHWQFCTKMPRS